MALETSTPDAGLEQAAPESSVEQRLANLFSQDKARAQHKALPKPEAAEAPVTEQAAEDQAPEPEETPADLPDGDVEPEEVQSEGETWKIVHNGTEVTLDREAMIRHAQQGFDYDRKSQALAEDRKVTQELLQAAQRVQQAAPQLMSELAQVRALESQMQQWDKVDWVDLATNQPLEYPRYRAQFDQLERSYRMARGNYEQKQNAFQQEQAQITANLTRQEAARLPDIVPEFRDAKTYQKAAPEIRDYLLKRGIPEALIDDMRLASLVAVAYDGLRYSKLVASKGAVQKQVRAAAPMAKPGAAQSPQSAADRSYQQQRATLKKTGSVDAAAALLARLGTGKRS